MSFMLEFPPTGPLSKAARSPPYVLFGIKDVDHFDNLPPKIPLELVVHFAPRLRQFIVPAPVLTRAGINEALRIPYVGVNIVHDNIDIYGLKWIVNTMLRCAGLPLAPDTFLTMPTIHDCISIRKTWLALELHPAGLDGVHTHLQMVLSMGDAVTFGEIKAIWAAFPTNSPIVLHMGLNFVQSHLNFTYSQTQFSNIRHWYLDNAERYKFFHALISKFPEFDEVHVNLIRKTLTERIEASMERKEMKTPDEPSEARTAERVLGRTRRLSRKRSDRSVGSAESPGRKPPSRPVPLIPQQTAVETSEASKLEETTEQHELNMLLQRSTLD